MAHLGASPVPIPVCSWVEAAGGSLPASAEEEGEEGSNAVEVSPLVSYDGEGLQPLVEGRSFKEAYDLDLQVGA